MVALARLAKRISSTKKIITRIDRGEKNYMKFKTPTQQRKQVPG